MMKKRFLALGLVGALALGTCTVSAASGTKDISATFRNIKIVVDGKELSTSAEPFIYNGTTYLPIRAVGEAVGKEVTWNGGTNTVYLGEVPADAVQQPAPAQKASSVADLPIFLKSVGLSQQEAAKVFGLVQSGQQSASLVTDVYFEILTGRSANVPDCDAKAVYAEAQAALSLLTGAPDHDAVKAEFDAFYQSEILPKL